MSNLNLHLAVGVAAKRMGLPSKKLEEHLTGDTDHFFAHVGDLISSVTTEAREQWERDTPDMSQMEYVQKYVASALFLLGRCYEEMETVDKAMNGSLNYLCTSEAHEKEVNDDE